MKILKFKLQQTIIINMWSFLSKVGLMQMHCVKLCPDKKKTEKLKMKEKQT